MRQKRFSPFEITGIDSLGQGVSKLDEKVTFIAKTAPGDKGEAEILAERKGVAFGKIHKLTEASSRRIQPECIHFDTCPSCHYLHLDYEQEIVYKKESFEKLLRKLSIEKIEIVPAPRRFGYRNRIQLHYSLKSQLLGMRDPQTFAITPIPNCLIGLPEVISEVKRLYSHQNWLKEAPKNLNEGHVEIYWIDGQLKTSWNRPYAEGGFTQVFEEMNQKLKTILQEEWRAESPISLVDLFAGNGNLSNGLNYSKRLGVDIYTNVPGPDFFSQNLYEDKALNRVLSELKKRSINADYLLLDPPRSGLKNISEWTEALKPQSVAYVSCDPHTLARDLMSLSDYSIRKAFLIDFFPSTFHFESFIILERKS